MIRTDEAVARRTFLKAAGVFAISRLILAVWGRAASNTVPWIAFHVWDATAYTRHALTGYDVPSAYFPGYPLLLRVFDRDPVLVGWLVSNMTGIIGIGLCAVWAARRLSSQTGLRMAVLYAVFPQTLFLSAAYPESLMLILGAGTMLLLPTKPWLAAILASAASAVRPNGIFLALSVLFGSSSQRRIRLVQTALASLGLLAFMAFNAAAFNDLFAHVHAQQTWHRALVQSHTLAEWRVQLDRLIQPGTYALRSPYGTIFDPLLCLIAFPLMFLAVQKRWWAELAYVAPSVLVPIVFSPPFHRSLAFGKTFLVLFPLMALLAERTPHVPWSWLLAAILGMLALYYTSFFVSGFLVG